MNLQKNFDLIPQLFAGLGVRGYTKRDPQPMPNQTISWQVPLRREVKAAWLFPGGSLPQPMSNQTIKFH